MEEWQNDDPLKSEIKREVKQEIQYEQGLRDFERQATEFFYSRHPDLRPVDGTVRQVASERLQELSQQHPEWWSSGVFRVPADKVPEEVDGLASRTRDRVTEATRPPSAPERGTDWRAYEPTDTDREAAIREEQERYQRLKGSGA
jgi:hypothetical protein